MRLTLIVVTGFVSASLLLETTQTRAATVEIDLGGLVAIVSDSPTAQVFHIVDQLSEWDQYTHRQYARWARQALELDAQDRKLLQQHAEMRRARGWGNGFEQAFYVDDPIEVAAAHAVDAKLLSPEEAAMEQAVLLHFEPLLASLRERGAGSIVRLRHRLVTEAGDIGALMRKLQQFAESKRPPRVPVFLVPSPDDPRSTAGGGFNGGRLVLEVQNSSDVLPTFLHECMHALLEPRHAAIEAAAGSAALDTTTLNEGIAYALGPGVMDDPTVSDTLVDVLVRRVLRGSPASDSYLQFYMVAAVIRPLLRSALARGETLSDFLPKAVEKWRNVAAR